MENYEVKIIPTAGSIQCDFEAVEAYLKGRLEEYRGVIFTEDTKTDAKKEVAKLRKEKKEYCDSIKEARNEYMAPFEAFAERANTIVSMYDEPINFINEQVAEFERKRAKEKKQLIKQLYEEYISDMEDFLPLVKIYNPKWENATTNKKAICEELMSRKEAAKQAIAAIKGMGSDVEEIALNMYKETFDLAKSMTYITQYEKQKADIREREQERIRREEEERIRREEREKMEAERKAEEDKQAVLRQAEFEKQQAIDAAKVEAAQEVVDSLIPTDLEGETSLYEYRIALTAEGKEKLEMYLDSVGVDWELI